MVIVAYIVFGIGCLIASYFFVPLIILFFSNMKEKTKEERKKSFKRMGEGLLIYIAMALVGFLIFEWLPALFR